MTMLRGCCRYNAISRTQRDDGLVLVQKGVYAHCSSPPSVFLPRWKNARRVAQNLLNREGKNRFCIPWNALLPALAIEFVVLLLAGSRGVLRDFQSRVLDRADHLPCVVMYP